jgi:hypothetical protein
MAFDFPSSPTVGQQYSPVAGTTYIYNGVGWALVSGGGIGNASPQGRLTLQTLAPVMTTTQSAKTTIYYTPYVGNLVPIYDGSSFTMTTCNEISVATTDTSKNPAAIGASKVNDWFIWSDAGTLRLTHGPDWTNDTTRSAGTALTRVNGIWLNNAAITNGPAASRGTYVGTTRSNASSQLDWQYATTGSGVPGLPGIFSVWNMYNRVAVSSMYVDGTANWSSTNTTRMQNGSANARFSFVSGLAEEGPNVCNTLGFVQGGANGNNGVALDQTSTINSPWAASFPAASGLFCNTSPWFVLPQLGYHFLQAMEAAGSGGVFYGSSYSGFQFNMRM